MFAFSQVEPGTRGQLEKPQIPLSRYLGAAWDQGLHDSMGGSLYRISEQFQIEHDVSFWGALDQQAGRTLTADEANAQYGRPRLQFTEPVKEGVAAMLKERHLANDERNFLLSEGATSVGRVAASFGVGMLASLANPVDFTTMFFPIVGSEAAAAKLGALGAGSIRQGLARGLISEQALGSSRVAAAVIEGTVGQAVAEIPLYISNRMDQTPYTLADSALNVLLGGVFAAGIRLSLDSAGRLVKKLSPATKEAAFKKAAADFLAGENIEVHKLVELDEAAIREKVKFDIVAAKAQALMDVDAKMPEIRAWAEAQLDTEGHLGGVDQPNLLKIADDWIKIWEQQGKDTALVKKLQSNALTDPSPANLQNLASQFNLKFDPLEKKFPSTYYVAPDPARQRMMRAAGLSEQDLATPGQVSNAVRRQQAAELEAKRELKIQKLVGDEKERRTKAYVEELRKKFDPEQETRRKLNSETTRQQNEGKVLTEEQVRKYEPGAVSDESDIAVLQKDVDELKKSLGVEEVDEIPMGDDAAPKTAVDKIISALEAVKMKELPPGTRNSGIPPEVWNGFIDLVIEGVKAGGRLYKVVEDVLAGLQPSRQMTEKEAVETLMNWAERGVKGVSHSDVTAAARALKKRATVMTVYRATTRDAAQGVGGWSTEKSAAIEYGERSATPYKIIEKQALAVSHETLLQVLEELDMTDVAEADFMTFFIEQEAFVLDNVLTKTQADEMRAKLYDTTAELRPGAMISFEEFRADAGKMLAASINLDGRTARAAIHFSAMEQLDDVPAAVADAARISYDGFITKTQRHVTRDEAVLLSNFGEAIDMMRMYGPFDTRYDPISPEFKAMYEIGTDEGIAKATAALLPSLPIKDVHRGMVMRALHDGLPVSSAAVKEHRLRKPGGYVEKGDLLVPSGNNLSKILEDELLLDHLRDCLLK